MEVRDHRLDHQQPVLQFGLDQRRNRTQRRAAVHPAAPLGAVPAMVEAELQDRLVLIETVIADLHDRPAAG